MTIQNRSSIGRPEYPLLAAMVSKYLSSPASSALGERIFSTDGKIFRPECCNLCVCKIEFPGDILVRNELKTKLQTVKVALREQPGGAVTNTDILNNVLDFWIQAHQHDQYVYINRNGIVAATRDNANEDLFIKSQSSLQRCIELVEDHTRICNRQLDISSITRNGHVAITKLNCGNRGDIHRLRWSSSPCLANGEYLINHIPWIHHKWHAACALCAIFRSVRYWCDWQEIQKEDAGNIPCSFRNLSRESTKDAILHEMAGYEGNEAIQA